MLFFGSILIGILCLMIVSSLREQHKADETKNVPENVKKAQEKDEAEDAPSLVDVDYKEEYIDQVIKCIDTCKSDGMKARLNIIHSDMHRVFERVEERPEYEYDLKEFYDTYLPVVCKAVLSFNKMDSNGLNSDRASYLKEEVKEGVELFITAHKDFLETLYYSEAVDVSTDLKAMTTLLKQDGFLQEEFQEAAQHKKTKKFGEKVNLVSEKANAREERRLKSLREKIEEEIEEETKRVEEEKEKERLRQEKEAARLKREREAALAKRRKKEDMYSDVFKEEEPSWEKPAWKEPVRIVPNPVVGVRDMEPYKDLAGMSGVIAYTIHDDSIDVLFNDYSRYTYSYDSAGKNNVEYMKRLAKMGGGLNGFINRYVYEQYVPGSRVVLEPDRMMQ